MGDCGVLLSIQGKVLASIPLPSLGSLSSPASASSSSTSSSPSSSTSSSPSSSSTSSSSSCSSSASEEKCASALDASLSPPLTSLKIGNLAVLYAVLPDNSLLLTRQRRAHNFSEVVFNASRHIRPDEIQKREQVISPLIYFIY